MATLGKTATPSETQAVALKRSLPSLSSMEEESIREKRRGSLLKECRRLIEKGDYGTRLARDQFRRAFSTQVGFFFNI